METQIGTVPARKNTIKTNKQINRKMSTLETNLKANLIEKDFNYYIFQLRSFEKNMLQKVSDRALLKVKIYS